MRTKSFDKLPEREREQELVKLLHEAIQRAEQDQKYGRTNIEIVWNEGRIRTVKFTDEETYKFE